MASGQCATAENQQTTGSSSALHSICVHYTQTMACMQRTLPVLAAVHTVQQAVVKPSVRLSGRNHTRCIQTLSTEDL
jgi:hypothetical protein